MKRDQYTSLLTLHTGELRKTNQIKVLYVSDLKGASSV